MNQTAPDVGSERLLTVRDLTVSFPGSEFPARVVEGVSLSVARHETLAVVGESGSGKSMTALAIMRLLPDSAVVERGQIHLHEGDRTTALESLGPRTMRRIRGGRIAMIFQEPMTSLNPVLTIGDQLLEAVRLHRPEATDAKRLVTDELERMGIRDAGSRLGAYPHEFSGGMRQRVMIAMALLCRPCVLIADEPTTALDVTVQAQVLDLIDQARRERDLGVMLITHDLGLVAQRSNRICVMYRGRVVECGSTREVLATPAHPYTRALISCMPGVGRRGGRLPIVSEIMSSGESIRGTLGGLTPWWPEHDPPPGGTLPGASSVLVPAGPGRLVGVWAEPMALACGSTDV
ncbi:MAG: ABC transporter ATP-binding protein [Phycisphaeraceae bacterium]|nr:ABC transporter ATP-binding protein [Phycisphaeraceae bacterium]MCW5769763.1 ABC transporter ATP-binding protein [Phycisphaeraceae bacterium]